MISCLAADMTTVKTGSDNCYPYWDEGSGMVVGLERDAKATEIKNDYFVWLTQEGVKCRDKTNTKDLLGYKNCKPVIGSGCSATKLKRLGLTPGSNSSSICIPAITWKARDTPLA